FLVLARGAVRADARYSDFEPTGSLPLRDSAGLAPDFPERRTTVLYARPETLSTKRGRGRPGGTVRRGVRGRGRPGGTVRRGVRGRTVPARARRTRAGGARWYARARDGAHPSRPARAARPAGPAVAPAPATLRTRQPRELPTATPHASGGARAPARVRARTRLARYGAGAGARRRHAVVVAVAQTERADRRRAVPRRRLRGGQDAPAGVRLCAGRHPAQALRQLPGVGLPHRRHGHGTGAGGARERRTPVHRRVRARRPGQHAHRQDVPGFGVRAWR